MIIVLLPWTNGIIIKKGNWVKTRQKNIEKEKQTKNREVDLSCHHYLKQVARVKKVITIFNLIVLRTFFYIYAILFLKLKIDFSNDKFIIYV